MISKPDIDPMAIALSAADWSLQWPRMIRAIRGCVADLGEVPASMAARQARDRLLAVSEGRCDDEEACAACPVHCWLKRPRC